MPSTSREPKQRERLTCGWIVDLDPDGGESWDAECGAKHQFMTGGPRENEHRFCPYCGKVLLSRRPR